MSLNRAGFFHSEKIIETSALSGNIVECGVAWGSTIGFIKCLQNSTEDTRQVWAFDSFEGFSKPTQHDGKIFNEQSDIFNKKYSQYSLEVVKTNLLSIGLSQDDLRAVQFVKGWIPDSFNNYSGDQVSLLNVDVDIYEPTRDTLEYFWPLMQSSGIVLLDDYGFGKDSEKWPGAKKAVDEFCKQNGIDVQRHYTGKYYLIKT